MARLEVIEVKSHRGALGSGDVAQVRALCKAAAQLEVAATRTEREKPAGARITVEDDPPMVGLRTIRVVFINSESAKDSPALQDLIRAFPHFSFTVYDRNGRGHLVNAAIMQELKLGTDLKSLFGTGWPNEGPYATETARAFQDLSSS